MKLTRLAIALLASVALPAGALATGPAESASMAEQTEPVRVYTNADLEEFERPETSVEPYVEEWYDGWEFVSQYLAREYARIDADRAYGLAQEELDLRRPRELEPRYALAYAPYGPFVPRFHGHGKPRLGLRHPGRITRRPCAFGSACGLSGADVFPGPPPPKRAR